LPGELRKDGKPKTAADKRTEATEVCLAIERAEMQARSGTLTEDNAKKIIGEILERTTGVALLNFTVREWFNHWLDMEQPVLAPKTMARYRQVVRDFLASLRARADLGLAHITSREILAYRDAITGAGKSPRTANLSIKVISAAFNAALRQRHVPANPCLALKSLSIDAEAKATFSPNQISRLLRIAEGDWRGAILLAYYTGARLTDVANMQWDAVDLEQGVIKFIPSKTKKRQKAVTIPLHADLQRVLLERPGVGKALLFPSLAGKGTGGRHGLSGRFVAIMEKAGIEGRITQRAEGGRALSNLTFHSLRHSFNSAMANAGVSQEIRQLLTGHASPEQNKTYTHRELEPLRAAISSIPSVGR
jgi:integrase